MPRVKKETKMLYKVFDLLLWGQIRALGWVKNEEERGRSSWYLTLENKINQKLDWYDVSCDDRIYVKHYVLCLLQVRSLCSHPNYAGAITPFVPDEHESMKELTQSLKKIGNVNLTLGLALISAYLTDKKINKDTVLSIEAELQADEELSISTKPLAFFIDLAFSVYVQANPFCALDLYCYAQLAGLVDSTKLKEKETGKETYKTKDIVQKRACREALIWLGLHREFCAIAEHVWCQTLNYCVEREPSEYENGLKVKIENNGVEVYSGSLAYITSSEVLTIDLKLLKSKSGTKVMKSLLSEDFKIHGFPLPERAITDENISVLLEYITEAYDLRVLTYTGEKAGTHFSLGKVLSSLCSVQLGFLKKFNESDDNKKPFYCLNNYEDKESPSIVLDWSTYLLDHYGIKVASKTLYNSYLERMSGKGITSFEELWQQWEKFEGGLTYYIAPCLWYMYQCFAAHLDLALDRAPTITTKVKV